MAVTVMVIAAMIKKFSKKYIRTYIEQKVP